MYLLLDFSIIFDRQQLDFQLEDVNSHWLAIYCYSGVPGLSTGSLSLIWSQWENLAFILVVYLMV